MRSIEVGQIGVGYWGPNLLRNLVANSRCGRVVVAEADQKRRDYVAERFPDAPETMEAFALQARLTPRSSKKPTKRKPTKIEDTGLLDAVAELAV